MMRPSVRFFGGGKNAVPVWTTPSSLGTFNGYSFFSQQLVATSPISATVTYSVDGVLPAGLSLNGDTVSGMVRNPAGASEVRTFKIIAATGTETSEQEFSMTANRVTTSDPYADQVLFYYPANGNYNDSSMYSRSIVATSANANLQVQTTEKKWGTGAFEFRGSSIATTQDMRVPAHPDLDVGTSPFTLEWWAKPSATQTQYSVWMCSAAGAAGVNGTADTLNGVSIWAQPTGSANKFGFKCGNTATMNSTITNVNDNTWRHFAIVRVGNTITGYVNGSAEITYTYSGSVDFGSQFGIKLGMWVSTNSASNGYRGFLDDLRLTKAARYTGNFTPPAAEFTFP